jgi:hypothetical protein
MTTSLGKRTVMSSFAFSGDLKLDLAALIVPITRNGPFHHFFAWSDSLARAASTLTSHKGICQRRRGYSPRLHNESHHSPNAALVPNLRCSLPQLWPRAPIG